MKFLKFFPSFILFSSLSFPLMAQASDVISLPTITVMAEEELREEDVGILPYQEDEDVKDVYLQLVASWCRVFGELLGNNKNMASKTWYHNLL